MNNDVPVLGFAAFSGTGKTTLLTILIELLTDKGIRVAVIKQSHHDFEIDVPGKDSYELRKAGASQTLITSPHRWALIQENKKISAKPLSKAIALLDCNNLDIILVEGYKLEKFPKIELHRATLKKPLLYPDDTTIIALASDEKDATHSIPVLDLNEPVTIFNFIEQQFLQPR